MKFLPLTFWAQVIAFPFHFIAVSASTLPAELMDNNALGVRLALLNVKPFSGPPVYIFSVVGL